MADWSNSPRQGSFFTRNSSSAIQPPPTRTITVLRKIRTSRSCWESPNCGGGRKTQGEREKSFAREASGCCATVEIKMVWIIKCIPISLSVELNRCRSRSTIMQKRMNRCNRNYFCLNRNDFRFMLHRFTHGELWHKILTHTNHATVNPTGEWECWMWLTLFSCVWRKFWFVSCPVSIDSLLC